MRIHTVRRAVRPTLTVGVQGAGGHTGTTHTTLMLATYLAAVKGYRVAVANLSPHNHLKQAEELRTSLCKNKYHKLFTMYGQADEDLVMELIRLPQKDRFDVILVDCGDANQVSGDEPGKRMFYYCNRRLIVASLSWWRLAESTAYLERCRDLWPDGKPGDSGCDAFLGYGFVLQTAAYLKQQYGIRVREIPYEPDPFCLHEAGLAFCDSLTFDW